MKRRHAHIKVSDMQVHTAQKEGCSAFNNRWQGCRISVLFYETIVSVTVGMCFSRKLVQSVLCVCWWDFQWQPERKGEDLAPGLWGHVVLLCLLLPWQRALLEHAMAIMACSDVQEVGMLVWHEL